MSGAPVTKSKMVYDIGTRSDPLETCISRRVVENIKHVYTHKVSLDATIFSIKT